MRKLFAIVLFVLLAVSWGLAQTKAAPKAANPKAILDTTAGRITCTLFPDKAPNGVANFIGLAEGTKEWTSPVTHQKRKGIPFYEGTIFHRVIPGFMIQGGDPLGNGTGDPGYGFGLEVTPDLKFDRPGRLAYARSQDPNSNGSQFFITVAPYPSLNMKYTIFGQCGNMDVVEKIVNAARNPSNDKPYNPVKIDKVTIVRAGAGAAK